MFPSTCATVSVGSTGAAEGAGTERDVTVCEDPVAADCGCASAVGPPASCAASSASDAGTSGNVASQAISSIGVVSASSGTSPLT